MHTWFVDDPTKRQGLGQFFDDSVLFGLSCSNKSCMHFSLGYGGCLTRLRHSRTGRNDGCQRQGYDCGRPWGEPNAYKFIAFGVSSFLAGIAGAMYAYAHPTIALDVTTGEPFSLTMSVLYLAMVVLGALGPPLSSCWSFGLGPFSSGRNGRRTHVSDSFSTEQQGAIVFFLCCVFFLFLNHRILGVWLRIKRYFMAWPFKY